MIEEALGQFADAYTSSRKTERMRAKLKTLLRQVNARTINVVANPTKRLLHVVTADECINDFVSSGYASPEAIRL